MDRRAWKLWSVFCLFGVFKCVMSGSANSDPSPISLPPTQFWDGNDGPWSTFSMQVGSPSQQLRLLPSTSGNAIWPVLKDGACPSDEPDSCPRLRASFFRPNESTTWSDIGIYELLLSQENVLGLAANGSFGFDQATLGLPGTSNMPTLNQTIIGAFLDTSIYLGALGLYPRAVNLSTTNEPRLSFLGGLKNQSSIPSTSWAYTAGAHYRQPTAFGSLTLGGYDTVAFEPNNITFSFGPDQSRDLIVGLQGIDSDNQSLLPSGIYAFLDSLVPDIWLPMEACQRFEAVFGLSYNTTAERYFVNDTLHSSLMAMKPNITFSLGPVSSGGAAVRILMRYGSLDLLYQDVKSGWESRYFPLRRAENTSMYTLGRAFFQDAYVIADYDRANFSVSQAIFPNTSSIQNLVAITSPGAEASIKKVLADWSIAVIVISACILISVVATFAWLWWKRRQKRRDLTENDAKASDAALSQDEVYHGNELTSDNTRHELKEETRGTPELENPDKYPFIGLAHSRLESLVEMAAVEQAGAELQGLIGGPRAELPNDQLTSNGSPSAKTNMPKQDLC